jgi:hypothetical protein
MIALGLRCTNRGYTYSIASGTKSSPEVLGLDTVAAPKGYAKPHVLKWFFQELEDRLRAHKVAVIAIKGTEGLAPRGPTFVDRVHLEAIAFLIGGVHGIRVVQKVKSTIAKDLGLKGKARYLKTLDTSTLADFAGQPEVVKDALQIALSELPDG